MRTINKVLVGVTIAAAGFATVGAGAGADFIDNSSATQGITAGSLSISLSDGTHTSQGTTSTPASLTLAAIGPTSSSFSDYKTITATNTGNVTATVRDLRLTTSGDVNPLADDVHISVANSKGYYTCSGSVAHCTNTNLTPTVDGALGYPPAIGTYTLAPGASLVIHISTYAGGLSGAPALTNADEGKVLNETLTYTIAG